MTIVGVGNPYRGDDAAGLIAVQRVRQRKPGVRVVEWTGDLVEMFDAVAPESSVIIVDAVLTGAAPGTVLRWDASARPLPERGMRASTHAFSVSTAIELARAIGRLPASVVLYGIEGVTFDEGAGMSPQVSASIDQVVESVIEEAGRHA